MKIIPSVESRARILTGLPLSVALSCVALVAAGGWVWSFEEQTRWATSLGFATPQLLSLVLDGLALSLAGVAFAAALDGRPAVMARIGTLIAVLSSSASNGAAAWSRTTGDPLTVTVAATVPVAANLAFEVFLGELRRQVQRKRGMPAPVAIPWPRLVRLTLAPIQTFKAWKRVVLELTEPSLTDRSATDLIDPTDTSATGEGSSPPETTDPAAEATTTDPIESTPRPPVESSIGSGTKADPEPAGKPAGSTPPRPDRPANRADPGEAGGPAPAPPQTAQPAPPRPAAARPASHSVPDSWSRVGGSVDARLEALRHAVKVGWITRPVSESAVKAVVEAGTGPAREMRDQINAEDDDATEGADQEAAHG